MRSQKTARGLEIGIMAVFLCLAVGVDGLQAHSSDFVFARWSQDSVSRVVELSLSAQVSNNTNLESRQQAVQVLTSLMQLSNGGRDDWIPVANMAEVSTVLGTEFPADSPVPIGGGASLEQMESGEAETDGDEANEHEVITLTWRWLPTAAEKSMCFLLPADSQQNVIFWWAQQAEQNSQQGVCSGAGKQVPWQILLGGDESFVLDLLPQKTDHSERAGKMGQQFKSLTTIVSVAGLLLGCYGFAKLRRQSKAS